MSAPLCTVVRVVGGVDMHEDLHSPLLSVIRIPF